MAFMSLDTTDLRDDPKYLYTIDNINTMNQFIVGQKRNKSNIVKNIENNITESIMIQDSKNIYKFLPSLNKDINLQKNVSALSVNLILNNNNIIPADGIFINFNN